MYSEYVCKRVIYKAVVQKQTQIDFRTIDVQTQKKQPARQRIQNSVVLELFYLSYPSSQSQANSFDYCFFNVLCVIVVVALTVVSAMGEGRSKGRMQSM